MTYQTKLYVKKSEQTDVYASSESVAVAAICRRHDISAQRKVVMKQFVGKSLQVQPRRVLLNGAVLLVHHALRFMLVAMFVIGCSCRTLAATSLSQFGITWTFDRDYPTGRFANGDYWVVGPVTMATISPRSEQGIHGSMINPVPGAGQAKHGFDRRIRNNVYVPTLNVASSFPFTLPPGTSLLSAESNIADATGDNPQLRTIAILTVLDAPAAHGSFRPPYCGSEKTIQWNLSQLRYEHLRSVRPVAGTPALSTVEAKFERPWIEIATNWTGRYLHPDANQPAYGREIAHTLADGLLSLHLNYSKRQKETLLIRLVQYGIDIYGAAVAGATWDNNGGHNQGRKMPLLLAATVLGDGSMIAHGDKRQHFIFHEDQQTFYVSEHDVTRARFTTDGRRRDPYITEMIGTPEWGEKHASEPTRDGSNWDISYRDVSGACTIGHILTARLMGLEAAWGWEPIFDYYDRYWVQENAFTNKGPNGIQPFVKEMWKAYRSAKPQYRRTFKSSGSNR